MEFEELWSLAVSANKPTFSSSLLAIFIGQIATGGVALLTEILYARLLGPAARGTIGLALMSVAFGTLIGGLGGEGSIVYWASRSKETASSWLTAIFLTGSLGCLVSAFLWYFAYWQIHFSFLRGLTDSSARVVLFSIPSAVLLTYAMAMATGMEQFRLRSVCALFRQIIVIGSFLALLIPLGRTVDTALWGNFAGSFLASVILLAALWASVRRFSRFKGVAEHIQPTIVYGIRGQVGNLASFFNYRLDVFIVNYFLGPAQLGLYAVGVAVSEGLWQIPNAVAAVLFPRTGRTAEQDATQFNCFVLRQVFLMTTICAALIALASPVVIPLLFGARFRPSIAVIWWILPGTVALSLAKVACSDLAGRGKNGYGSASAFVCFGAIALLDWALIPRMGIVGASLASSISYSLDAILILAALQYESRAGWKKLLVPSRTDFDAYRLLWLRLRKVVRLLSSPQSSSEIAYSSPEGR